MFTGIVEDIGKVEQIRLVGDVYELQVTTSLDLADTQLGDSIAVNGVCLTVTSLQISQPTRVTFDVGPETLRVTSLSNLARGHHVHLERALRLSDRLGGHLVQGHVDGIGTLCERRSHAETLELRIRTSATVLALCIPKGSIAIDGVSLTINQLGADWLEVWLIPHTLEKTRLADLKVGDQVNLENDLIGKYVQRLLGGAKASGDAVTWDLLRKSGFMGDSD